MRRGDLYRVRHPRGDPKQHRIFVVVSRQRLIDSKFHSVICAPVFSSGQGLATQVAVNTPEGLKHPSWILCDNLISIHKSELTNFIGSISAMKIGDLDRALKAALDLR